VQFCCDRIVMQAGQVLSLIEHLRVDAEADQRLRQLQPERAGTDHRHRARQVRQVENGFIGQHPVAERCEHRRDIRMRTGRDDDGLGFDLPPIVEHQRGRIDEMGAAADPDIGWDLFDGLDGAGGKRVAFLAYARHHGGAVDFGLGHLDAEDRSGTRRMGCMGGGDQQLGRHAADSGAGGAGKFIVDEQRGGAIGAGTPLGSQAGGAGADNRDVAIKISHEDSLLL
jgi:hypothetical protein